MLVKVGAAASSLLRLGGNGGSEAGSNAGALTVYTLPEEVVLVLAPVLFDATERPDLVEAIDSRES